MRHAAMACALACLTVFPARAEIAVATAAELAALLPDAPEGETLLLAPGDFGTLSVTAQTRGGQALTIRSADPAHPARFSALALNGAANLTLDGLVFDYRFQKGDPLWTAPFGIFDSRNLTIRGSLFDGDIARGVSAVDDGAGVGIGLTVDKSRGITLSGNRFTSFLRGLAVSDSDHVTVIGNEVTAIRSDGMDFAAVQSLLVAENTLHDFKAARQSEDHADMIQFWTAGTTRPSRDIVIRDNVLNSGNGDWTQSILIGNELVAQGVAGREMYYRNVTITGNVIINSHLHGITLGETLGLTIAHNTLIHNARSDGPEHNPTLWTPRINIAERSERVTVEANATAAISGAEGRTDWVVRGNILIQDTDPAAPNFYDTVFVAALTGDPGKLSSFAYLPGGPVDGVTAGAKRLASVPGKAGAVIRATRDPRFVNQFAFDADQSSGLAGAKVRWDFSDGTMAEGLRATHVFAAPGDFTARLTVTPPDGPPLEETALLRVPSPQVLHFDPVSGQVLLGPDSAVAPDIATEPAPDGKGHALRLGWVPIRVAVTNLAGAQDFRLRLDLRLGAVPDPSGEILRLPDVMSLSWKPSSGFAFRLETTKVRPVTIATGPMQLDPAAWHLLDVRYEGATGRLALTVDGTLRANGRSAGPIMGQGLQDLTLGDPAGDLAGGKVFDGHLRALDLEADLGAYAPVP